LPQITLMSGRGGGVGSLTEKGGVREAAGCSTSERCSFLPWMSRWLDRGGAGAGRSGQPSRAASAEPDRPWAWWTVHRHVASMAGGRGGRWRSPVAGTANGKVVGAAAGVAEGGLQSRAVRRPAVARGGGWQRLAVEDGYGSGRKRLAVFK
jgi:hypothetical protein